SPPAVAQPMPAASTATPPASPAPARRPGLAYPVARTGDVVETHHGIKVADPYRWMEDMDSEQTRAWVTAENALTDAYLATLPGREALAKRIGELLTSEH